MNHFINIKDIPIFKLRKIISDARKRKLRRKKSIQKSKQKLLTSILQKENKLEDELSQRKRLNI